MYPITQIYSEQQLQLRYCRSDFRMKSQIGKESCYSNVNHWIEMNVSD
jgi:hypothetical protein